MGPRASSIVGDAAALYEIQGGLFPSVFLGCIYRNSMSLGLLWVQEAEAKRKRRESNERSSRNARRHLPGAVQLHAELQAMPDDDDGDLGDRRSGTPSRRVARGVLPYSCFFLTPALSRVSRAAGRVVVGPGCC